ncbi:MAG: hypothetical protein LBI43_06235 [Streptococcaceae bacterium]|jgi:hypothetical protein|nr:hypothetical protein [Streptococcaceae bacterium]
MTDFKKNYLTTAESFEGIYSATFETAKLAPENDADVAQILTDLPDSAEKTDVTTNFDNLAKVNNVVQLQSEMMVEFVRANLASVVQRLNSDEDVSEELLSMQLYTQERLIKLHDQLDFFFANFAEEDLKKGFSIARRSASALKYEISKDKETVTGFIRTLSHETLAYLKCVADLHDWVHAMLNLLDGELQAAGMQGIMPKNN